MQLSINYVLNPLVDWISVMSQLRIALTQNPNVIQKNAANAHISSHSLDSSSCDDNNKTIVFIILSKAAIICTLNFFDSWNKS
jgi:hypothetical protein